MKCLKTNYAWCSFFLLLILALIFPFQDGDVFFYLSMGRWIFEKGSLPDHDPFLYSFQNWHVVHEWLSYIVFYFFFWLGSWSGLILMKVALWLLPFGALRWFSRDWKIQDSFSLMILFLTGVACSHRFVERASLFSDVALALMALYFLRPRVPSKRVLFCLPLLFVFWVNFHPAFVLGLALYTIYVLTLGRRPVPGIWLSLGMSYLACLLNPLFLEGALYPVRTAFKDEWSLYKKFNYEWMPTFQEPFLSTWEVRFLIALVVVTAGLLVLNLLKSRRQSLFALLAFGLFLYLAQTASRFMPTSALGFAALSLFSLRELKIQFAEKWNQGLVAVLTIFFLTLAGWVAFDGYTPASGYRYLGIGPDIGTFPLKAVEFIESKNLQGRFFNQYDWGSYLAWALSRENFLFLHGHVDDPTLLVHHYHGMNAVGPFFDETVRKYDIRYFILDKTKLLVQPPPAILSHLQSWKILYQDEMSAIWERP